MGFVLQNDEAVGDGLRRIACEQIDRALEELDDDDLEPGKVVHQVRKRCKKLRGLLRLVRKSFQGDYGDENRHLRDTARLFAPLRDADTRLATLDALGDVEPGVRQSSHGALRQTLVEQRDSIRERAGDAPFEKAVGRLRDARDRVGKWQVDASGFDAVKKGLEKTYGRGRDAMDEAIRDPSPEGFHEWRKRVKYHAYHVRLLKKTWAPVLEPHHDAVKELSDLLGLDHDLAVLRAHLVADPDRFEPGAELAACLMAIDRRRARLAANARVLGRRVHSEKPRHLSRRFAGYWRAWRAEAGTEKVRAIGA